MDDKGSGNLDDANGIIGRVKLVQVDANGGLKFTCDLVRLCGLLKRPVSLACLCIQQVKLGRGCVAKDIPDLHNDRYTHTHTDTAKDNTGKGRTATDRHRQRPK